MDTSKKAFAAGLAFMFVLGMLGGIMVLSWATQEEPVEEWQAALYISNWTNSTLDIDAYVFASETVLYSITLDHEENVTLTVTWQEVKNTIAILHCVGTDIDTWLAYELEPGEWESVILW